jgi:hypothetical protein
MNILLDPDVLDFISLAFVLGIILGILFLISEK